MAGSLKDLSSYDVEISNIKNDMENSNGKIEEATNAVISFNKTIQEQNKVVDDLNQKVEENNATAVSAKILEFEVNLNLSPKTIDKIRSTRVNCKSNLVLPPGGVHRSEGPQDFVIFLSIKGQF